MISASVEVKTLLLSDNVEVQTETHDIATKHQILNELFARVHKRNAHAPPNTDEEINKPDSDIIRYMDFFCRSNFGKQRIIPKQRILEYHIHTKYGKLQVNMNPVKACEERTLYEWQAALCAREVSQDPINCTGSPQDNRNSVINKHTLQNLSHITLSQVSPQNQSLHKHKTSYTYRNIKHKVLKS